MSINLDYIVNKINEIIQFSNETRHAMHIAISDDTLIKGIFNTGVNTKRARLNPNIKELTYITERDIIGTPKAGKKRKKATLKKPVKY